MNWLAVCLILSYILLLAPAAFVPLLSLVGSGSQQDPLLAPQMHPNSLPPLPQSSPFLEQLSSDSFSIVGSYQVRRRKLCSALHPERAA